ncbi:hypothetical protein PC129_g2443 [Phytophthora cactorum]|uniref:Uncharacterized protein n=1 Tax=Phytophthora cactorum TaxID=29920 RepID=A0A329T274_9STRA|nr:hypothetical protein PC112_g3951 [Phytophthora cactorum]KAG2841821.1 hypothetical protein PC111_g2953 [Phytophthora cactorum]KAG2865068.1 hypothetical protein PC113_g4030 [Phytophthora cactorum]KAG2924488.1 hypothetical protein PC114_g4455 [Phytophthora cactorum]KAG2950705.1 hypothetical protein PC117_g4206 [Phytophthora cactorum]
MTTVWFLLVNRELIPRRLNEIAAGDLKVYKDWEAYGPRQKPLRADARIGEYAKNVASALIVEVPKIWFQLVNADTGDALTGAASVPLTDENSVEDLQNAVGKEYSANHLVGTVASDLKVYVSSSVCKDSGNAHKLLPSDKLPGLGKDANSALIVAVPVAVSVRMRELEVPSIPAGSPRRGLRGLISDVVSRRENVNVSGEDIEPASAWFPDKMSVITERD